MKELAFEQRYPQRALKWQLRTRAVPFGRRPLLMGIINVTPDSFSDGGRYMDPGAAVEHGLRLEAEGAGMLDVGGESTRPYSKGIGEAEERRRLERVLTGLARQARVPLSVDTSKSAIARMAIDAGVEIVNDVTGLEGDPEMVRVAVESGVAVCAMHMQGTPQTMQEKPTYDDVVQDIFGYLQARRDALLQAGMDAERICLDPGVGFGKTHQHNLTLLAHCHRYHALGCPLLVGHSRKGFIGKVLGDRQTDRTAGTIGTALALARQGVQILRVHDVAAVRQALLLFDASGGMDGRPAELEST